MKKIFIYILIFKVVAGIAQETMDSFDFQLERMVQIPGSPEAEEFTEYGNTAVDLYSGTTDLSIPLFTIKGSEINIPISLTYNTSGIKVEQEASIIGLGWNLNVGGRISRIVNGLADETINGNGNYSTINDSEVRNNLLYYSQNLSQNQHSSIEEAHNYLEFMRDININKIDAQPDYYSLYAPGLNDFFIPDINDYKNTNKAVNNPRTKIIKNANGGNISWQITSENGTVYFFEESEKFKSHNEVTSNNSIKNSIVEYEKSWLLTKIISPLAKDTLEFEYNNFDYYRDHLDYSSRIQKIQKYPNASPYIIYDGTASIANWATKKILSKIKYNGNLVLTTNLQNRYDVSAGRFNSRLNYLEVFSPQGAFITKFQFNNQDYFNLDGGLPQNKEFRDIRLKLNSLSELDENDNLYKIYKFEYIQPDNVPSRTSNAKDYFGYYTGRTDRGSQLEACNIAGIHFDGANRTPSKFDHAQYGLLKKITYPTGGSTVFNFEKHDYYLQNSELNEVNVASKVVEENTPPRISYSSDCDDQFQNPIITSAVFTLLEETSLKIYYEGDSKFSQGFIINGTLTNYCDLTPSKVEWAHASNPSNNITLPAGTYSIIVLVGENVGQYGSTSLHLTKKSLDYIEKNVEVGGIRINEIIDYTSDNNIAKKRIFEYKDSLGKSTGRINHIPSLTTHKTYLDDDNRQVIITTRKASFSTPNIPMVTYDSVKELTVDKEGFSEGYVNNEFYYGLKGVVPNVSEPGGNNFIPSLNAGQLKKQTIFNSDNKRVLSKEYEYFQESGILIRGLSTYVDDRYRFDCNSYTYVAEEFNTGTSDYYVSLYMAPVSRKVNASCPCSGSPTEGGNCFIFPMQHDYIFSDEFSGLNLGITSSGTLYGGVSKQSSIKYFYDEIGNPSEVTNSTETFYKREIDYLPEKLVFTKSDGGRVETSNFYPKNLDTNVSSNLIDQNRLVTVLKSQNTVKDADEVILSNSSMSTLFEEEESSGFILPSSVQSAKGNGVIGHPEDRLVYHDYKNGYPIEISKNNGPHTMYILGYNTVRPIAIIENASYKNLPLSAKNLITEIEFASKNENSKEQEALLRNLFNDLRNHPHFAQSKITSYTYDLYVGVTSVTDYKGVTVYYEYDNFNRLKEIKKGNDILKDYDYKNNGQTN